ncbi:hypothetical protein [Micromonospora cremea]|uniref:hypothetical protein n=1 Tax=Micromonospora cremea TaxID=709881 RepID=UPI00117CCC42|nr:hypothetical protein [Micromonospora cremea]
MDAQTAVDAEILFGWPVEAIDELAALSRQAHAGSISIGDWRSRDREMRAQLPPLSDHDRKSVADLKRELIRSGGYESDDGDRLFSRLHAMITPAPDNAKLRQRLTRVADLRKESDAEMQASLDKGRERILRWLREEGDDDRDPVTMLPWSFIAQFRVVDEPKLGPLPQPINAARKRALERATVEQVAEARAMSGQRVDALAAASSNMALYALTLFPKLLIEADPDDPKAAELPHAMRDLWDNPATQRALRRETADGWPPEYE